MNYKSMKREDLINKLEEQKHLSSAVTAKDMEINEHLRTIEDLRRELVGAKEEGRLAAEKTWQSTRKQLTDDLAVATKRAESIDKLRVEQLNIVLFAHGDLLKTLQGIVDTHMKLNTYIVNSLNGGEE